MTRLPRLAGAAAVAGFALLVVAPASAQLGKWAHHVEKTVRTVKQANVHIDETEERSLGRAVAANLIARFGLSKDEGVTPYVVLVGNHVASWSSRPELPWRFAVLDTDEINAFACPGGYVFLTRGALDLAEDESELAALLAHEIQHVTERHAVQSIEAGQRNKVVVSGLVDEGAGRLGADPRLVHAFGELTDEITQTLLETGLSRSLETEADEGAIRLLADAGYDPQALPRILERMAETKDARKLGMLKRTHPPADRRARDAAKEMTQEKLEPRPDDRFADLFVAATTRSAG